MQLWTTFSPQKVCWELTTIQNNGKGGTSDWLLNQKLIEESLILLKQAGIAGIRLVIFPGEITKDGKSFNWIPIDNMLVLCSKNKLLVDLCIGPFQYPYYPGIYLPKKIREASHGNETRFVKGLRQTSYAKRYGHRNRHTLDDDKNLNNYGLRFLEKQLTRYGKDSRIRGFHFANEWPDKQHISGREDVKATVSKTFMLEATRVIKKLTKKPISMNTNIDAAQGSKVFDTFKDIFAILDRQGKLGFDIYPSQETWRNVPLQKLMRLVEPYKSSFTSACQRFSPCEIYFAEVEAQPWGDGRSWYNIIHTVPNPEEEVLTYSRESLKITWEKHIADTSCETISLWGSDFWLSANAMGIVWPIEQIKKLKSES